MTQPIEIAPSTRLGRYEVISRIARGGMATVYLGRMLSKGAFQRSVAIKVLHPELACDPGFVAMFLDEARLSAQIRHANVVDVYDVDAEEGHIFIVMSFIEGASLFELMKLARKKNLLVPRSVAVRIVFDALSGLHAAHELTDADGRRLDIIHRDVSPQNLLVGLDGVTRVTDFGVAKSAGRLATTNTRDTVKGKLQYLAPEQVQRDADIDCRVDVFAAGIILWEALTSRPLFVGDTHSATLAALLTQPIPKPGKYLVDLPTPIEDVCLKALERDPDQRFASAGEFADALEEAAGTMLATTKTVGKFVAQVAPPNPDRRRAVLQSTPGAHDLAQAEVVAITPQQPPGRKLTPLGQSRAKPNESKPLAPPRPAPPAVASTKPASATDDDVPTRIANSGPPSAPPTEVDPPNVSPRSVAPPAAAVVGTAEGDAEPQSALGARPSQTSSSSDALESRPIASEGYTRTESSASPMVLSEERADVLDARREKTRRIAIAAVAAAALLGLAAWGVAAMRDNKAAARNDADGATSSRPASGATARVATVPTVSATASAVTEPVASSALATSTEPTSEPSAAASAARTVPAPLANGMQRPWPTSRPSINGKPIPHYVP